LLYFKLLNDGTSEHFAPKLVDILEGLKKNRVRSIIYDKIPIIWRKDGKIGPVNPEIIGLPEIIKKNIGKTWIYTSFSIFSRDVAMAIK